MFIGILLLGSCLNNLSANKRSTITLILGGLPEGAGTTNAQIVGMVGGGVACITVAIEPHQYTSYISSQTVVKGLVKQEEYLTASFFCFLCQKTCFPLSCLVA
jgi:hypothetical protein